MILKIPLIIHLKDVWLLQPKIGRILMKINPQAIYIAVSRHVEKLFTKKYKVPKKNTFMIYDGIDTTIFTPLNKEEIATKFNQKTKHVVMVSRIAKQRDIELFIDTAAIVSKEYPHLNFIHYGYNPHGTDQNYFNQLKSQVKAVGLEKKFTFHPYIAKQTDMAKELHAAFAMLVPAKQFALPNVAIESLCCGTPVIASNVGGNPEIVADKDGGYLVPAQSVLLYTQALKQLLKNKNNYIEMTLQGQIRVSHKFAAKPLFNKLDSLYRRLLHSELTG